MNEDYKQLIISFRDEYRIFVELDNDAVLWNTSMINRRKGMLKQLATLSSITGSMRAIRELSDEEIMKANAVEQAEEIINEKVIARIMLNF